MRRLRIADMPGQGFIPIVCTLMLLATAGCTSSSSLPTLQTPQSIPQARNADTSQAPVVVASMVPGTPTEIYTMVARNALRCWFGAGGPLEQTHVFHAEAESPSKGGAAQIILQERDESMRDKKGARAFSVSFSSAPAGVRLAIATLRIEPRLAQVMAADAAAWAKGGTGCGLRRLFPPPALTPVVGRRDPSAGKKR